jgi:type IV secretory pathway VirB10-like protein
MILEGWRDAIWSGLYTAVRYDCASPSVARWISRLAKKVGLTDSDFKAFVQTTAEQIAALSPAAPDHEPAIDQAKPSGESDPAPDQEAETAPVPAPAPPPPMQIKPPVLPPSEPETAETEAERRWRYRDILGIEEPKPRRRWRR